MARSKEVGLQPGGFCAATLGVVRVMIPSRKHDVDLLGK